MVYNPPRNGKGRRKGVEHKHTKEQDDTFFASRLAELKRQLKKLGPKTKFNTATYDYIEGQIKSIEKKLNPQKTEKKAEGNVAH